MKEIFFTLWHFSFERNSFFIFKKIFLALFHSIAADAEAFSCMNALTPKVFRVEWTENKNEITFLAAFVLLDLRESHIVQEKCVFAS